ncbi:collagen triple helix repeat-containing protein 1-like [Oculina patagonica]
MKTKFLIVLTLFTTGILFTAANSTQKACPAVNGHPGIPGSPGLPGPYGRDGAKGDKGEKGETGLKGEKGGTQASSNWKQCVWRSGDGQDNGLLKDCLFKKVHDSTALHVFYSGALRVYGCTSCCKRWFFTFNGAECSGPMPIDGIVYMQVSGEQPLRVRHIEGYCENIPKGRVRVGFNVGNCKSYGNADAASGWNSVSRIVVEEVPAPQQ